MGDGNQEDMNRLLTMNLASKWYLFASIMVLSIGVLLESVWLPQVQGETESVSVTEHNRHIVDETLDQGNLDPRLKGWFPRGRYVVVDTGQNRVYLRQGLKTLYEAIASTGSGMALQDPRNPEGGWKFETPRGVFTITHKLQNPLWVKPDWAFIEEGLPIPTKVNDRFESGTLGDYALGFGNGYFIHGTLYTRLLGTNVTHGCIRLGDDDLRYIYHSVPIGTTIIIF